MSRGRIAIVGSVQKDRGYDPHVRNHDQADAVAQQIGNALALADLELVVYAASFIEGPVVTGYVKAGKAQPQSITVVYPSRDSVEFAEYNDSRFQPLFDLRPHPDDNWEMSYYKSLRDVDGVVLIGGARSTLITGVLARAFAIPIVAVQFFGGAAESIWRSLVPWSDDLVSESARNQMAMTPSASTIDLWVNSLLEQKKEKEQRAHAKGSKTSTVLAAAFLLMTVITVPIFLGLGPGPLPMINGKADPTLGHHLYAGLLFLSPIVAGIAGAITGRVWRRSTEGWLRVALLGALAGFVAGLLYVLSQSFGSRSVYESPWQIQPFALIFGLLGGFTFEASLKKLESIDAIRSEALVANAK